MQAKTFTAPTTEEIKKSWNTYAPIYSQMVEKPFLQFGLSLARMLQITEAQNILELGCGSGRLTLALLSTLPAGTKYTSLDLSEEMIRLAQEMKDEFVKKANIEGIDHKFVVGNAEQLSDIADGSMDVVLLPLCIHVTPDAKKILKEAMRVLKKGGKIGFNVLGNPESSSFFTIFNDRLKEEKIESKGRSIHYLGTREILTGLAQECGIKVDFCWLETAVLAFFDRKDVELLARGPANSKALSGVDEEKKQQIVENMVKDFEGKKKSFNPLQAESVLLVGRKPE